MICVAVDASLRSTGVCTLWGPPEDPNLLEFGLIQHTDVIGESLIQKIADDVVGYVGRALRASRPMETTGTGICFVIEGLAYGAVSSTRDAICGMHWHIRCEVAHHFPEVAIGVISPSEWFARAVTKETAKTYKASGDKRWRKNVVFDALPAPLQDAFRSLVQDKCPKKKEAVYDLADAFFLGKYRMTLKEEEE
jgi:hypothetical protein